MNDSQVKGLWALFFVVMVVGVVVGAVNAVVGGA